MLRITQDKWKSGLADEKKTSADKFGQTQNSLRWVKGMLKWLETWVQPKLLDLEVAGRPSYEVRPDLMCAHFNSGRDGDLMINNQRRKCNPSLTYDPDIPQTDIPQTDIPWNSPDLYKHRVKFKSRVLSTLVNFVINDVSLFSKSILIAAVPYRFVLTFLLALFLLFYYYFYYSSNRVDAPNMIFNRKRMTTMLKNGFKNLKHRTPNRTKKR